MKKHSGTLCIAEVPYDTGEIWARYSRYLSDDGTRWIRHGLFIAYHRNGQLQTEGHYEDDLETGVWQDYHQNGQLAAKGEYRHGKEDGRWHHWAPDGTLEKDVIYRDGEEIGS